MKKKFKVGDKVVGKGIISCPNIDGMVGKIIVVEKPGSTFDYGVEFNDKHILFHSCGNNGKHGHCYWVTSYDIEPLKEEVIVIYRKGNEVIALDKRTNKKTTSRCHPDDKFDFEVGANIAFNRLLGKEIKENVQGTPKLYNGKFVVTKCSDLFAYTVGKIYEVKDGCWICDNGIGIPVAQNLCRTFNDVKRVCTADIIEVVE